MKNLIVGSACFILLLGIFFVFSGFRGSDDIEVGGMSTSESLVPDEPATHLAMVLSPERRLEGAHPSGKVGITEYASISVSDSTGRPIEGVEISRIAFPGNSRIGVTNSQGLLVLTSPLLPSILAFSHPGFALLKKQTGALSGGQRLEVVLASGARIEGTVVYDGTGLPVGPGVAVVAQLSEGRGIDQYGLLLAGESSPGALSVHTDEDGRFSLKRLELGGSYDLIAAASGLYGRSSGPGRAAGTSGVEIRVSTLYGLLIQLESPFGEVGVPNDWMEDYASAGLLRTIGFSNAGATLVPDAVANLTGKEYCSKEQERFLIVMRPSARGGSIGPMTIEANLPGYRPNSYTVYPKVLDDNFRATHIPLIPDCSGFSRIDIQVKQFPGDIDRVDPLLQAGFLVLHSAQHGILRLGMTFGMLQKGSPFTGIPYGEYEAHFVGHLGLASVSVSNSMNVVGQGAELVVNSPESTIELDFSNVGALELEHLGTDGLPRVVAGGGSPLWNKVNANGEPGFVGRGTLTIDRLTPGRTLLVLAEPGLYRMAPLPWSRVTCLSPRVDADVLGKLVAPVEVAVVRGEVSVVTWMDLF